MPNHRDINRLPKTFDELVDALGGTTNTARIVGRTSVQVCHWRKRYGVFPAETYIDVANALVERGYGGAPPHLFKFNRARRTG